jgi:hypothetical protein
MTPHERETELTTEVERELRAFDQAIAGLPVDPEFEDAAEFARELRAERPEPDEEFTESLDARATAGFHGGGSLFARAGSRIEAIVSRVRGARSGRSTRGRSLRGSLVWGGGAAAVIVGAIVLIVGVGVSQIGNGGVSDDSLDSVTLSEGSSQAGRAESAEEPALDSATADSGGGDAVTESAAPASEGALGFTPSDRTANRDPSNRKVQRDAKLQLSTTPSEVRGVADQAIEVIEANRGIVFNSRINDNGDSSSVARLNVSVPTDRLQATLAELSDLAMVESRRDSSQDITANFRNAETRLSDFQAERESLLARLANATTAQESESIRRRLRIVDRQIAQARAAVQRVERRAELATIDLTVRGDGGGPSSGGWSIGAAADDAVDILRFLAGVGIVAAAVLVPLVALLLLAWLVRRRVVSSQRERALDQ